MDHSVIYVFVTDSNTKINPLYYKEKDICRICLESEGEMLNICHCKGSIKFVHKECIELWINTTNNIEARTKCQLCQTNFDLSNIDTCRTIRQRSNCFNVCLSDNCLIIGIVFFVVMLVVLSIVIFNAIN